MNSKSKILSWVLRRSLVPVLLALAFIASPLHAKDAAYLSTSHLDPIALLAPPPLPDSAEQAADMAETIAVHNVCTTNEEALAKAESKFFIYSFTPAIGEFFQSTNLPKTDAFFRRVLKETKSVTDTAKNYWQRPRPFVANPSLISADPEKSFGYPSGHSTRATVDALLLAELVPDKRDEILAVGREIGWRRVLGASHYPTDIYAGRVLAQAIVRELKSDPDFQRDFAEVKGEIAAARTASKN
jgi:acid phosphatase (class A)